MTTDAKVVKVPVQHSPATRYLPLFTYEGRFRPVGRMHLAKPKSTTRGFAPAWCGHTYWIDRTRASVTGQDALLLSGDGEQPTCALCLAQIGASEW